MAAGWGCKIGDRTVRFDDLSLDAWIRIQHDSGASWFEAYNAPMRDLAAARITVEECVKVAEPDADPTIRVAELAPNVKALDALIVAVDDDMPTEFQETPRGMVPLGAAEGTSTTT